MQKLILLAAMSAACLLYSCGNSDLKKDQQQEDEFFPVSEYISSQLHMLDSLQLPVTRYYKSPDYGDTTALSLAETRKQAAPFLEQDINSSNLKPRYREESFADQSIPSITLTYQTKDSLLPLKRVDVILKPDPVRTDKVKSIYMEKFYQTGDSLVNEKLFWKVDHYYQVIRTKQVQGNQPVMSQLKVVWDPTE